MILVDTSIWIDHLRRGDATLAELLERTRVLTHPFVLGELACGSLADRDETLSLLGNLPSATSAEAGEALAFIERHALWGKGIGYVDVHLLAAVALTQGSLLWTRDKRLLAVAESMDCHFRGLDA